MAETTPPSQSPALPRRRPRWRVVGWCVAAVLLIMLGYWFVFSPTRIAAMAERIIENIIGGDVDIGLAKLGLDGELEINNIRVRAEGMDGEAGEVFHADRIVLTIDRKALLLARFVPTDIVLVRPTLTLAEDEATGLLNFQLLRPQPGDTAIPGQLPRISVVDGRYRCAVARGQTLEVLGQIDVAGHMVNDSLNPAVFRLSLIEQRDGLPHPDGIGVSGMFDVRQRIAYGQLTGLGFEDRFRVLLPGSVRELWDLMEPVGRLPKIDFTSDPQHGWSAVVSFSDVALTLPPLTEADYRFRMTGVKGAFRFRHEKIETTEDLVGQIEGLEYRIAGASDGYGAGASFRFALQTQPFDLPAEPRFIYALPEPVQKVFRILTPEGRIRVSMAVFRDQPGGDVDYQGTATILSGKGRYQKFPYELEHCRGTINFNRQRIDVLSLTGETSGGGTATVSGVISPPGDDPAVDLTITAVNIPFDETLYEAFEPEYRQALDMFFHRESYERLRERGHFIEVAEYNADEQAAAQIRRQMMLLRDDADPAQRVKLQLELDRLNRRLAVPAFDLGGRANVIINVTRPQGAGEDKRIEAEVDIQEASVLFKFFPYPVRVSGGRLRIVPGRAEFHDVVSTGLHGGSGGFSGYVSFPRKGRGKVIPEVEMYVTDLPIDEMLFDALPQPQDRWVRDLHATGRMSVVGRIFADAQQEPAVDLLIDLHHVWAAPGAATFALRDVEGQLRLSLHEMEFREVRGVHDDGEIILSGTANWHNKDDPALDLHATIRRFRFEEPVMELFKPFVDFEGEAIQFLQSRNLVGEYDAEVQYRSGPADDEHVRIDLRPRSMTLDYLGSRLSFTDMHGSLHIGEDRMTLDDLSGDFDGGRISADGVITLSPRMVAELTAEIHGDAVTDSLRRMMPAAMGRLLQSLQFDGRYQVRLDPMILRPEAGDGEPQAQLTAHVELIDAEFSPGVNVDHIHAALDVDARMIGGEPWPRLDVAVNVESLQIVGRTITDLTARLHSDIEHGTLLMPSMRGHLHGGVIGGMGAVSLDDRRFSFQLALTDVDLSQLVYERPPPSQPAAPANGEVDQTPDHPMVGRLAAALDFVGRWDDPDTLRGRGDVQIRNGRMYDLPLSMGLLQMTHLTLPVTRSFERAAMSYYVRKGVITFERLALESPTMRLAGEGTMDYRSRELDLTLTSSNPSGLNLGPVSDIINTLRDQLVTIHITGTVDDPQTKVKQFAGITDAWGDIFGSREQQED